MEEKVIDIDIDKDTKIKLYGNLDSNIKKLKNILMLLFLIEIII